MADVANHKADPIENSRPTFIPEAPQPDRPDPFADFRTFGNLQLIPEQQNSKRPDWLDRPGEMAFLTEHKLLLSSSDTAELKIRDQLKSNGNPYKVLDSFAEYFKAVREEFKLFPGQLTALLKAQNEYQNRNDKSKPAPPLIEPWVHKNIHKPMDEDSKMDLQSRVAVGNEMLDLFRKQYKGFPGEEMNRALLQGKK